MLWPKDHSIIHLKNQSVLQFIFIVNKLGPAHNKREREREREREKEFSSKVREWTRRETSRYISVMMFVYLHLMSHETVLVCCFCLCICVDKLHYY